MVTTKNAILAMQQLALGSTKPRGRPPAWMSEGIRKKRGRPLGGKNKTKESCRCLTKFSDLDDLRTAFWAPSTNDQMNASAANALYVQRRSHGIGSAFITLLCHLILDQGDSTHTRDTRWMFHERFCLEGRGASCTYGCGGALGSRWLYYG